MKKSIISQLFAIIIVPIFFLLYFYLSEQMKLVLLASLVGALLGCFTGLVPGIHANTIAILLFSLTIAIEGSLEFLSDLIDVKILIVVAIASTSITHTFLNFIPGTILGAPEENNALGVLPMHEMILRKPIRKCKTIEPNPDIGEEGRRGCNNYIYFPKENRNKNPSFDTKCPECGETGLDKEGCIIEKAPGYLAIYYSAIGSLYAAIFCILLVIPLKLLFGRESLVEERGYDMAKEFMLEILFLVTLILIFTDRARLKKFKYKPGNKVTSAYGFKESQVDNRILKELKIKLTPDSKETIDKGKGKFLLTEAGIDLGWQGRVIGITVVSGVFLLSGAFGWIVLNYIEGTADSPLNNILRKNYGFYLPSTTLFPAFTGLFGIATLYFSRKTNPEYSDQAKGERYVYSDMIDLEEGVIYSENITDKLGYEHHKKYSDRRGFLKGLFSLFRIRKVPEFQCRKCDLYYQRQNKTGKIIPKCATDKNPEGCGEEYKIESINYRNSGIGAITGSGAGLLPGVTAGIGTIIAMFFKNGFANTKTKLNGFIRKAPSSSSYSFSERFLWLEKLISKFKYNENKRDYSEDNDFNARSEDVIMTLAAVNTAASLTILAGLFIILRPRNGTTIVIDQMITVNEWMEPSITGMPLVLQCLLISVLVSIIIGFIFTATIGLESMNIILDLKEKIPNFTRVAMEVMIIALIILVLIFTGIVGTAVLFVGAFIGLLPPYLGIRKSHAMGFLLVPVMIFYYNMSGIPWIS